ncbi:MAG: iron-containing alcohol dehydrogenase [Victivallales bacterium]|jgi:alcohol dehydrogenase class IV|nr:iron-containing alcohol dehydrogenase [Victivallales bacterium]
MNCEFKLPAEILFGCKERRKLAEKLPPGNVLIIAGSHSKQRVENELIPDLGKREFRLIANAHPEPRLSDVQFAISVGREITAASVIGYGGGSAIDIAKTAAALMHLDGTVADYFYGRKKIPGKGSFFAALPTTAGTGAEITPNAVLSDPETGSKQSIRHETMFADVALIDPELTFDCPVNVSAGSGFDALTQAIESFISQKANPASDALALSAAKNIFSELSAAVHDSMNSARIAVAKGSMLGAMAFAQSGLGAVHGIGHPLGSLLHVPHGVCCAILLPTILRWNLPDCRTKMTELANTLSCETPEELIVKIETLRENICLPSNFRAFGLRVEHFAFIVENCRSGSMKSNPRDLTDPEITAILEELM